MAVVEVVGVTLLDQDLKKMKEEVISGLDHHSFYRKGRYQKTKYVLLLIDIERHDTIHKKINFVGNISVEHILPQTPTHEYWKELFTEENQWEWTHRLGNLTLLNDRKNYQASNKPFTEKVEDYFVKRSDFQVTEELRGYEDWSLNHLKSRHRS